MKRSFPICALLHFCLLGSQALAATGATNVWYSGGSYDGSDIRSASAALFPLSVNNASGATNVTIANAWLNGMLLSTSNGESAKVYAYWGPTDATTDRGLWTNTVEIGDFTDGQMVTIQVGVEPSVMYYYRFYATNGVGEAWASTSASFLAPGQPVLNNGFGAMPVGSTEATLNGNMTLGVSASNYIVWGTTDWGTTNGNWANTIILGLRGNGTFCSPISGLDQGTVYYYRCYATNDYGPGWSETLTFTTRVGSVYYNGGSYDGSDLCTVQVVPLKEVRGGVILVR